MRKESHRDRLMCFLFSFLFRRREVERRKKHKFSTINQRKTKLKEILTELVYLQGFLNYFTTDKPTCI
jgi:stalled ribosome alternative rescue factor ArfA